MVEKSERTEVNREDDDESFCPGKIDADDETCTLWAAFSEGPRSQQSGYQENREERTEGPNWFPTRPHHARFKLSVTTVSANAPFV